MQMPAEPLADPQQDYEELAAQHVSVKRIFALSRPYRWRILSVVVLLVVGSAIGMLAPFLLRTIIDDALPAADFSLLLSLVAGLVAVALLGAASAWLSCSASGKAMLASGVAKRR